MCSPLAARRLESGVMSRMGQFHGTPGVDGPDGLRWNRLEPGSQGCPHPAEHTGPLGLSPQRPLLQANLPHLFLETSALQAGQVVNSPRILVHRDLLS